jgi:serine/threonine protein kinase
LTKEIQGSFGYLMGLRPPEYKNFSDFMLAKIRFDSFQAMINAALCICDGFAKLHRDGYSYQDLNDGNFFIHPKTGDVLICDNDNVTEYGSNLGIAGKSRYMAPEIVVGEEKPDKWTDLYSLSVTLFLLFFNNHPLEGKTYSSQPCLTEKVEKKVFGENPVFIWDPKNESNRPVHGIHNNVIKRWVMYPEIVRTAFIRAFSEEAMKNKRQSRTLEVDWIKIFIQVRNQLVVCTNCHKETFLELSQDSTQCIECGKNIAKPPVLKLAREEIALYPGAKLYACHTQDNNDYTIVTGEIIPNTGKPELFGIRNLSPDTWIGITRDGTEKSITPQQIVPALKGIKFTFQGGKRAEII